MYVFLSLFLSQAPLPWSWEKSLPSLEATLEQLDLWDAHIDRLREVRPAWGEAGHRIDHWIDRSLEIRQLWAMLEMVHRPGARVRWMQARETALMNLEFILGEEDFRAGRLPRMPKGCYPKQEPKRAAIPEVFR